MADLWQIFIGMTNFLGILNAAGLTEDQKNTIVDYAPFVILGVALLITTPINDADSRRRYNVFWTVYGTLIARSLLRGTLTDAVIAVTPSVMCLGWNLLSQWFNRPATPIQEVGNAGRNDGNQIGPQAQPEDRGNDDGNLEELRAGLPPVPLNEC